MTPRQTARCYRDAADVIRRAKEELQASLHTKHPDDEICRCIDSLMRRAYLEELVALKAEALGVGYLDR